MAKVFDPSITRYMPNLFGPPRGMEKAGMARGADGGRAPIAPQPVAPSFSKTKQEYDRAGLIPSAVPTMQSFSFTTPDPTSPVEPFERGIVEGRGDLEGRYDAPRVPEKRYGVDGEPRRGDLRGGFTGIHAPIRVESPFDVRVAERDKSEMTVEEIESYVSPFEPEKDMVRDKDRRTDLGGGFAGARTSISQNQVVNKSQWTWSDEWNTTVYNTDKK